ncbi:conserved hypothetical protein [Pediculus humanus corporis]|uniref:Small integral membrane protein 12 n=1 Tax=Pediculus humanus subsp. corporis TaxID=121224 RepID=E0VPV7_PEDHC|nr:uncharacterized protein Phum_PHUM366130 [Pediculus humanus corporis]EEB15413.1 conserved hypothetical protein [Pediculus humanus corporis]
MYWALLSRLISNYSLVLVFPISATVGFIGYKIEQLISDRYTPALKSVKDEREERLLQEDKDVESLKKHAFVPKTIFEKNLSPSLKEPDPRLDKYKNGLM